MSPLEIRVLPIADLSPAPYHPRRVLSPRSMVYRRLRASLAEFGLVEPLVWNEPTGHLVGGQVRLAILKELGAAEVPVSVVRLTEAREKALNLVLNNREAQGRYDHARLVDLLVDLEPLPEFLLAGFDARVFSTLRMRPAEKRTEPEEVGRVEVTLAADPATFGRLARELDTLVTRYDLVTHVRRG